MTFTGIAVNMAVTRNRQLELPEVLLAFGLLILYAALTWMFSAFVFQVPEYEPVPTFVKLKSSLVDQLLTFLVFFYGIIQARDARSLLLVLVWITVVGNIITLVDTFNIPNLGILENAGRKAGRFDGFIGQPNLYGQVLILFMASTVAMWMTQSGVGRWLAAFGVFASFIALVMTGSRGSYMGLIVGSIFAVFVVRRYIPTAKVLRAGVAIVFVLAVAIVITFVSGYADVYLTSFGKFEGGTHIATSGRSTLWTNALSAMAERPWSFITGFGFDAYEVSRTYYKASHNTYLTYLHNLGVIGLFLYVFIFARIVARAHSAVAEAAGEYRPHLIAMIFGLIAFLIAIFFSEYNTSAYLLWAYLGTAMRIAVEMKGAELSVEEVPARLETASSSGSLTA